MPFCVYCSVYYSRAGLADFCGSCLDAWRDISLTGAGGLTSFTLPFKSHQIFSAYAYRDIARSSIIAYKAHGHRLIGEAIVRRLRQNESLLALLASCDVVMPVPSSLWGRLHGRLDLAYLLADTLRKHSGRSLVLPPRRLSWRWKKQTWIKRSQRRAHEYKQKNQYDAGFFASKALAIPNDRRLRVLIIDDVVTTANTLTDLADQFRNIDFLFFTLASAYRPNRTQRSGIEGCEIC